jgi:hypothetical protein
MLAFGMPALSIVALGMLALGMLALSKLGTLARQQIIAPAITSHAGALF